jgi:hypothetical protein
VRDTAHWNPRVHASWRRRDGGEAVLVLWMESAIVSGPSQSGCVFPDAQDLIRNIVSFQRSDNRLVLCQASNLG